MEDGERRELRLPAAGLEAIGRRAVASLPLECCGVLMGVEDAVAATVREWRRTANRFPGDRRSRYEIDPLELLDVHREARSRDLEVVGYYHSHPEGAAVPSRFDRERAWPGTSYLIVAVGAGGVREARSWRLDAEGRFRQQPLAIVGDAAPAAQAGVDYNPRREHG